MTKREQVQRLQQSLEVAQGSSKKGILERINELKLEIFNESNNIE